MFSAQYLHLHPPMTPRMLPPATADLTGVAKGANLRVRAVLGDQVTRRQISHELIKIAGKGGAYVETVTG
jgi:hypothetical protein